MDAAISSMVVADFKLTKNKRKASSEAGAEVEDSAMIKMATASRTPARIRITARDAEEERETSVTSKMARGRRDKSANVAESAINMQKSK